MGRAVTKRLRLGLLTSFVSRRGGGVYTAVVNHALAMQATGEVEPVLFGLEDGGYEETVQSLAGIKVVTRPVSGPRFFGYAPSLVQAMHDERLDMLHLHGIWMYPSMAAARWAAQTGRPYIISPHGMLDPWILARGRWKKALAKLVYERRSWTSARLMHALTEAERVDIAQAAPKAPARVIGNCVPIPDGHVRQGAPRKSFVYLGRIHPKKNVGALVAAWASLRDAVAANGYTLKIAGWGDQEHVDALKAEIAAVGDPSIAFLGPVFGEAKNDLLFGARFLVLASLSEGLPMTIIEAWAASTPTIISEQCNLPIGFEQGAAIRTGHSPQDVAAALRDAFAMDEANWRTMSDNARRIVDRHYSPESIASQWLAVYRELSSERRSVGATATG